MAYSNGVFTNIRDYTTDQANSVTPQSVRFDDNFDDIATGLSTCLLKNGTQTVTANIPMSTFKFTGLGNGSAATDSATVGQVQSGVVAWVDGGGTADAITATYSPAVTALSDGMLLGVRATAANATTTPTFSPNGLTARTIVKDGGQALRIGDIRADQHDLQLRYDSTNTRWELLNPAVNAAKLIETQTASASANLEFNDLPSGYTSFEVRFFNLLPASDGVTFRALLSSNNGSSYSATGDYCFSIDNVNTAGTAAASGSAAASEFALTPNVACNAAAPGVCGVMQMFGLLSAGIPMFTFHLVYAADGANPYAHCVGGLVKNSSATWNAIKFQFSAGNITSGSAQLWGIP